MLDASILLLKHVFFHFLYYSEYSLLSLSSPQDPAGSTIQIQLIFKAGTIHSMSLLY